MKYSITDNHKIINGVKLFQIKAEKDFSNIKKGDLGGWIEKEDNLSHKLDCWIYGDAQVSGDAGVFGNAQVSGDAGVSGNAKVFGNAKVYGDAKVYSGLWKYKNI